MPLTQQEELELQELESLTGLSPDEESELANLEAIAGGGDTTKGFSGVSGGWEEPKEYGLGEAIKTGASNITGESSKETLEGLYNMVRHPIQTGQALGGVASGAISHAIPEGKTKEFLKAKNIISDMDEETASMVWEGLVEDYGGYENIKRTIAEKPLQASIDMALIGRGVVNKASSTATKAGMPRLAKAIKYVDPLHTTTKVLGGIKKSMTSAGSEVVGVTTGSGAMTIKEAYIGGEKFRNAMRGGTTGKAIRDEAVGGLNKLKLKRNNEINATKRTLNMEQQLNINNVKSAVNQAKEKYGIVLNEKGKIIRSTIDKSEWSKMEDILNYVGEQGNIAGDLTGAGFHKLKKFLDSTSDTLINAKGQSSTGGKFVEAINKSVKTELDNISGYSAMNQKYSVSTQVINDIDNVLKLQGKQVETSINKLMQSLRQNKDYAKAMVDLLEKEAGVELTERIAGLTLNPKIPVGHLGRVLTGMGALGGGFVSPWFISVLGLGSPRVMGELVNIIGRTKRAMQKIPVKTGFAQGQALAQTSKAVPQESYTEEYDPERDEFLPVQ